MNLSTNFALEEFTASSTAKAFNINNSPTAAHLANLKTLAKVLQHLRDTLLHAPVIVTSGYRSAKLNRAVGGVSNSAHLTGNAADIVCPSFGTPYKLCKAIACSGVEFDQLIFEQASPASQWCHLGLSEQPRGQVLSWRKGKGYKTGVHKLW